ncbi:hypothetical protein FHS18_004852 [Paenibacillus phyllosphaerae]|uniref:Uncharacterized protein n=1 Tax=Paenibacillus phyllosphaerae TaxID=274593 RepID=A0A7W5FPU6_9BACL|nr:hypothetical protein [Paenibacillus phyllosphaerae]MBB3112750.1 hypothetical protein [Paenibacillus phyllosphaerae]
MAENQHPEQDKQQEEEIELQDLEQELSEEEQADVQGGGGRIKRRGR